MCGNVDISLIKAWCSTRRRSVILMNTIEIRIPKQTPSVKCWQKVVCRETWNFAFKSSDAPVEVDVKGAKRLRAAKKGREAGE